MCSCKFPRASQRKGGRKTQTQKTSLLEDLHAIAEVCEGCHDVLVQPLRLPLPTLPEHPDCLLHPSDVNAWGRALRVLAAGGGLVDVSNDRLRRLGSGGKSVKPPRCLSLRTWVCEKRHVTCAIQKLTGDFGEIQNRRTQFRMARKELAYTQRPNNTSRTGMPTGRQRESTDRPQTQHSACNNMPARLPTTDESGEPPRPNPMTLQNQPKRQNVRKRLQR